MNAAAVLWTWVAICCLLLTMACIPSDKALFSHPLDTVDGLELNATTAEVAEVQGVSALRLEGLLLVPEVELVNVALEVEILAEQACYPGIVFRYADQSSYELAYAVPHASDEPDAIQYDPVFRGSNTWQLHAGAPYQSRARVPMGEWFTLRVDVEGGRAVVRVGDQEPLVVERLSHDERPGRVGLWSFRPALFRNLRVELHRRLDAYSGTVPATPPGAVTEWLLEGAGPLQCEANGVLNLNRYLDAGAGPVRLVRGFQTGSDGEVELGVGFSDELELRLDGELLFEGTNTFRGFDDLASRGWVEAGSSSVRQPVAAGEHVLEATLGVTEPFGWGLLVTLGGEDLELLPVDPP